MPDPALARLINAAVAAQQRGVHPSILGACAAILEVSGVGSPGAAPSSAGGVGGDRWPGGDGGGSGAGVTAGDAAPSAVAAAVVGGESIERAIRKWLARRKPAEIVGDVRAWYASRGLAEPSLPTIQAVIAAAQAKRAARAEAARKAWSNKSPEEREAWKAQLGRPSREKTTGKKGRRKA